MAYFVRRFTGTPVLRLAEFARCPSASSECGSLPVERGYCQTGGVKWAIWRNVTAYNSAVTPVPVGTVKRFVWRLAAYTMVSLATLALTAYAIDSLVFRFRVSGNHGAYGQATVNHYDAVPQKNGKTEFIFDPPQVETCANALFPHAGYAPCWYLQRHTEQRTNF